MAGAEEISSLWVFEYENDTFAGADRYYTSGIRISRIADGRDAPDWLRSLAGRMPGIERDAELPYGFSISHNLFTPEDIRDPALPPDDRPYAAWLNAEFATGLLRDNGADRFRVNLGITGPAALGKPVQRAAHKLVGAHRPRGWSNQLKTEPTLLLGYDRMHRLDLFGRDEGWAVDASGLAGLTAGNAYTHANAGGFLRAGFNLPDDFGPPRITPAASGSGFFRPRARAGGYFYFGWEGRRVFHNLFLEGNTFGGRDGVQARRWIGEVFGGVVYARGPLRLAYTHVWRSREFVGQPREMQYGTFSVSLWW